MQAQKPTKRPRKPLAAYVPCTLGALAAFGMALLGVVAAAGQPRETFTRWWPLMQALEILIFLAFFIGNLIRALDARREKKKPLTADRLEDEVRALQVRQTESDPAAIAAMQARIDRTRRFIRAYAGALLLIACAVCFFLGPLYEPMAEGRAAFFNSALYMFLLFVNMIVAACAAGRLWPVYISQGLKDDPDIIPESDAPRLYACARRAAETLGVQGRIHMLTALDQTIGISWYGRDIAVLINASYLGVFSEDELQAAMLHEFAHMLEDRRLSDEMTWLSEDKPMLVNLGEVLFFGGLDNRLERGYQKYRLASSPFREAEADRAVAQHGDREVAASLLTKLAYIDLFDWEGQYQDIAGGMSVDDLPAVTISGRARAIREAFDRRGDFYASLVMRELPMRVNTHPIVRERLKRLGYDGPRLKAEAADPAWREETDRLLRAREAAFAADLKRSGIRDDVRRDEEAITAWQAAGEPVDEGYPDIVGALIHLERHAEAEALCRRAIDEKGDSDAAAYALLVLGDILLHRWDADGVSLIYEACARNSNALGQGLETLGEFFRLTGDQEGLDRYRAYVHDKTQWDIDVGSEQGQLKKGDRLSTESLPEALAGELMDKIAALDTSHEIERIYVVHKQIDDTHAVTPVVMRFRLETTLEREEELLHQLFLYLDSVDSWQFSIFNADDVPDVPLDKIPGSVFYPPVPR